MQQREGNQSGLSETNLKLYEARRQDNLNQNLPLPDLGVANSTYDGTKGRATAADLFIGNLPKTIIQGTARGAAVVAPAVGELFGADTGSVDLRTGAWWEDALFGEGELSVDAEIKDPLISAGASEDTAAAASAPLAVLFASLDVVPGGRVAKEGVMAFLSTAAKTNDLNLIKAEMKAVGFSDDSVVKWGAEFQNAKNIDEVEVIFKKAGAEEKVFKQLDNTPLNTVDETNPVTLGGKPFRETVVNTKNKVLNLFKKTDIDEAAPSRRAIAENETPSLKQFDEAIDTLRTVDASVDEVAEEVLDLRATVRTEPERFVETTKFVDESAPSLADDSLVDTDALKSPGIFTPEKREVFKTAVKNKENATTLREDFVSRLVDVEQEIVQQG